jgi:hypothetical protein
MKDRIAQLTAARQQLLQQIPDPSTILPGSLLRRRVRCNKAGCRYCVPGKGKGHGPITLLTVHLEGQRVRQIPIPKELQPQAEQGVQRFFELRQVLAHIARLNLEMLEERKRQRR